MRYVVPLAFLPLVLGAAAAVLTAAPTGSAGASSWTRVTDGNGRNTEQVGLARTGDGVLHVLWQRRTGSPRWSIMHTAVAPGGGTGATTVVLDGFNAVSNPDVVVLPDGRLRAFFMGLGATPEEGGVVSATAPPSGVGWVRDGVRVSSSNHAVGPVGATLTASGEPAFAYARSFFLGLHLGLDPTVADVKLSPDNRCCDYLPDLATDAGSGQTVLAWYSNANGRRGIWAQRVVPAPGSRLLAPGSVTGGRAAIQDGRTPITARLGGPGVYLGYCGGYPTCKRALLWRVGAGAPLEAGTGTRVEDVHVAAAPQGRLWVAWHDVKSKRVYARRTNKAATKFGPLVELPPPGGAASLWKLSGEGSRGPLDLFVSATTPGSLGTWHRRVLPRLSLAVAISDAKNTATFTVSDAGDPVAGAKVSVGGKTYTTNGAGKVSAVLAPGAYAATATVVEYEPAKASFSVS